jgi:hypothetical protein
MDSVALLIDTAGEWAEGGNKKGRDEVEGMAEGMTEGEREGVKEEVEG